MTRSTRSLVFRLGWTLTLVPAAVIVAINVLADPDTAGKTLATTVDVAFILSQFGLLMVAGAAAQRLWQAVPRRNRRD